MTEFVFTVAGKILEQVASLAYLEISQAWGVRDDLERLRRTVTSIQAVLLDEEEKQVHNRAITLWLQQLKDAFYDAEDVLADFQAEHLTREVLGLKHRRFLRKVSSIFYRSNPILFRFKMAHKLKDIWERLDEIAKTRKDFGLVERDDENRHVDRTEREMTHSFVNAIDIVGREEDKERIMSYLVQREDSRNLSVIPIVGFGGLGKTALAKLVYNDSWVEDNFEMRLWVCVSDDFDLKKVIVKVIACATGQDCRNMDIEPLQGALRQILEGKKYLLVIDDVWEEDQRKWLDLKALLMGGASGSKVIVTTRSIKVASMVGTIASYEIQSLPHEDCLKLFFRYTFQKGQQEQHHNLVKIGEEIVNKCGGVPLAIITLATLLSSTNNEREWKSVRDSEIWKLEQKGNDILPALRLSYDKLPPHLKRCFAACSVYPKDYEIGDIVLVELWMALGLLKPSNGSQDLEDVGRHYFQELVFRGFFQDVQEFYVFTRCKMHDLVHDLALSVSQNELFSVTPDCSMATLPSRGSVRLLSIDDPRLLPTIPKDLLTFLNNLEHVRLVRFQSPGNEPLFQKCLPKFRYVRMLDLHGSDIERLPRRIGSLIHLTCLDLSANLTIRRLPDSICNLYNLQTLNLADCEHLEELPMDMKYLVNLRTLSVTTQQAHLPDDGIGSLKSLRWLSFYKCSRMEHLCGDIQGLKNLRRLWIFVGNFKCRKRVFERF